MDETTARTAWEQSLSVVANLKAESHRIEAAILGLGLSPSGRELPLMYPDASTQATVNRLEQPCRTAQLEFTEAERYAQEDRKRALLAQERTEAAARELGSVGKEILTLESEKDDFTADKAEADRDAVASGERIKTLEASIKTAEGQTPRPIKRLAGLKSRLTQEKQKADEATQRSQKFGRLLGAVSKNLQELNTSVTRLKSEIAKGNSLREEIARLERLSALRSDILRDRLERYQTEVYAEFGGPGSIHRAFKMEITPPCEFEQACSERNQDTGLIRAIEIFPRQTALNVNKTHLTTNRTVVSAVGKSLGGFGGKLDYDRMREKYDQFVQQEVFASGFGKGRTSFGWTFGPTPGTSVLNPGTRTTYAALAVPANATAIEVESAGCSFHHNRTGPQAYPPLEGRVSRRDMEGVDCSHQSRFQLGLPDGHTAGGFEIREVRYAQVKPGERATIVLNGRFSPETTVLVNGKRLNQLAGLGKPQLPMDSGGLEDPGSGVISGSFEFVNTQYLAISLSIPADYKDAKFPQLTLISPARTAILNKIPVSVNGAPGQSLEAANLLKETKQPFEIKGFEFLGEDRATGLVTARLTGTRLGQIGNLWVDGRLRPDAVTPISDSDVLVRFAPSGRYRWEIVAATGESDPSRRASSTFSAPNPLKLMIAGTAVKTGSVSYDKDSKPVSAEVVIAGAGFRPELKLGVSGAAIAKSAYVSPTEWYCRIEKIQPERANDGVIFTLTPDKPEKPVASSAVSFPEKEHEKDKDPKANVKTTLTQIEKKVTTDK